jgi:hypothetical protein
MKNSLKIKIVLALVTLFSCGVASAQSNCKELQQAKNIMYKINCEKRTDLQDELTNVMVQMASSCPEALNEFNNWMRDVVNTGKLCS